MITRMEDWNPAEATAANFETTSLLGPLSRLGVFFPEWVRSMIYLNLCLLMSILAQSCADLLL